MSIVGREQTLKECCVSNICTVSSRPTKMITVSESDHAFSKGFVSAFPRRSLVMSDNNDSDAGLAPPPPTLTHDCAYLGAIAEVVYVSLRFL